MVNEIRTIDLVFAVAGLMLSILGLIQVLIGRNIEKKIRNFLAMLFGGLEIYLLCILIRELTYAQVGYKWVVISRIVLFVQAFFASMLIIILIALLLYLSGEKRWTRNRAFIIAIVFWGIYVIFLLYNNYSGLFFSIDDNNSYKRGAYFPLLIIPTVFMMLINLMLVWKKRDVLSKKQRIAFLIFSLTPMFATLVQTFVFGVHLIAISTVVAALFMLTYIIADQSERYYAKEVENAKLNMDIMLAQIQPHFLFNSLTTIRYLCGKNPILAQEAIEKFSEFLRHNMDSLTTDKPIDFDKELDHVKCYLEIQKLRFKDDLTVEYDIEYKDFKLPTLTLQPLVENAVTYGVRKSESGAGTVKIRTRKYEDHIEVIVEDDGPGFDYDTAFDSDVQSHVGIKNVEKRIQYICGGELVYDSILGKGTKATIKIDAGRK